MSAVLTIIKRHPLLAYFALVFAISWGSILIAVGPTGLFNSEANPALLMQFIYVAALAGPSIAGVLMTGLLHGRAGLRNLRSSMLLWRVDLRWYLVALMSAPLLMGATIFALSRTSSVYLPAIVTTDNWAGLLMSGIVMGLVVSFFEEIGWTGFATPELRKRFGFLSSGIILGVIWGAWHYPLFSGTASEAVSPVLYFGVLLFSFLIPFRILMVWVYDRTKSVIVVMLMHAPLAAGQLILLPSAISNQQAVIFDLALAGALWVVVAAVYMAIRRKRRSAALPAREASEFQR
jgi:membrane protease YdiL (CAAX protease family)